MGKQMVSQIYAPSFEEQSRQGFVGALKGFVNGPLEIELAKNYETKIKPEFQQEHGREPLDRDEGRHLFEQDNLFNLWCSMVYTSQDLLWETCGQTVDRQREQFEDIANGLGKPSSLAGSLELNPGLKLPEPIASTEIHRQPGGYFYAEDSADLTAPLQYFSSIELYRTAKGLSSGKDTGEPGMMNLLLHHLQNRFPDVKPKRILDMGCATGTETVGLHKAFPDAEIYGVDLSAPFLRFAHMWSEEQGVPVHYRQASADDTGFEDGYFDLIVSHIMFHETWTDILPKIMSEAKRLLAPNGIFFNLDVPYQPSNISLTKQVTNGWQEIHNGEPFWNKFADTDILGALNTAGFKGDNAFSYYVPLGQGQYYVFGGLAA